MFTTGELSSWAVLRKCNQQDSINASNTYSINMVKAMDLTGKIFDRWTVIGRVDNDKYGTTMWKCFCTCGEHGIVRGAELKNGTSTSCGCFNREIITKHGMHKSRPYKIWQGLKTKCTNSKQPNHERYGNRGINYPTKWETFEGFWEDMKTSYQDGLTIDRIDNTIGYSKDNCHWITPFEQNRNMRSNIFIEYNGIKYCLTDLATKINVSRRRLYHLHNKGYNGNELISRALDNNMRLSR